ncbi:MAG: FG-GAP-like repeat-containing protein [Parvularculaceae bacterium]
MVNALVKNAGAALLAIAALFIQSGAARAQTATTLQETYSIFHWLEFKPTIAVIGDGFQANDQAVFNTYVNDAVMRALRDDGFGQDLAAFRIVRININSADEGVTRVNATGAVTTARNTALDWRFSADWNRCWMEPGPNTDARTAAALAAVGVTATYTVHVLNDAGFGGCRRGSSLAVTRGAGWEVAAHEFGHMVGNLCDEYTARDETFAGGEPGCVNMTTNIARASLKWRDWVRPTTPLPTVLGGAITANTTGAFVGGLYVTTGIWRPDSNSRMNGNWAPFNPPSYDHLMNVMRTTSRFRFSETHVGDFSGDGLSDVAFYWRNAIYVFRSNGGNMLPYASLVDRVAGPGGEARVGFYSKITVGDFTGDGRDDLAVFNSLSNQMTIFRSTGTGFETARIFSGGLGDPAKPFSGSDQYKRIDYDGDGRDDLAVWNPSAFSTPVLYLYRSTGGGNFARTAAYTGVMPGWEMRAGDKHYIGDFTGDGREDIFVHNKANWSIGYLGMLRSTGTALAYSRRYDGSLPLWSGLLANDQFYVGDWNGDNKSDLAVFNSLDWCCRYLSMHLSDGSGLLAGRRYENNLPGWQMQRDDKFFVADINNDNRDDLYVYNATNWDKEYLGSMLSTGGGNLTGGWQKDWIGEWNLGSADKFLVGDFGAAGRQDLFIWNENWFGMLQSNGANVSQVSIHHKYVKDFDHHRYNWW